MMRRRFRLLSAVAALGIALAAGLAASAPFLGRFLDAENPLSSADAIYVLAGTESDRPLEAADLYQEGYAPLIVVSRGARDGASVVLEERGIHVPDDADEAHDILVQVGVPETAIIRIAKYHENTRDEAASLRALAAERRWQAVIVVTSKLHTRRAGLAMRQSLGDIGTRVIMRGSRYDLADPARWWRQRADVKMVLTELQFWIAYAIGLA